MFRPKKCMNCGGKPKLQLGNMPIIDINFDKVKEEDISSPTPEKSTTLSYADRIDEGIAKGIISGPLDEDGNERSARDYYNFVNPKPEKSPESPKIDPYWLFRGLKNGMSWLSGMVERGRQNRYDWMQQTALGQMNPMPTNDFQPNPYNLYMQKGGNLKNIIKDYNKYTNDAQMDMGDGMLDDQGMMKKGGIEIDRMFIMRRVLPQLLQLGRLGTSKYRQMGRVAQKGGYTSIVQLLSDRGQDASFGARKKMFDKYFDGKYSGTAEQNIAMLKMLQKLGNDLSAAKRVLQEPRKQPAKPIQRQTQPIQQPTQQSVQQPAQKSFWQAVTQGAVKNVSQNPNTSPSFWKTIMNNAESKAAAQASGLESGIIADKRSGKAYIIQDGKKVDEFNILTGKNVNANVRKSGVNDLTQFQGDEDRVTPVGSYYMHPGNLGKYLTDASHYRGRIMALNPIKNNGQAPPYILGLHETPVDKQYRNQYYGSSNPYQSSGCINCSPEDFDLKIRPRFGEKGDTLMVVDSKTSAGQNILKRYKKGGIHINPKNKGKFTASAKEHGMGVQEFASHVLANKEEYSPTQVKRANFARNASKWNRKAGGLTPNKARQILHDKSVHGKPLTDKQRRFFGAMSKGHTNFKGK